MSLSIFSNSKFFVVTRYTVFLLMVIGFSVGIRFYFFPADVPLNGDALYYFWYSSDIYQLGKLPDNWSPTNNGWPIFVSIFFTIFDSKDIFTLMQIQKLLSVLISVTIIIPTYFLCKKFVKKKFALIGATFIAFDPRLIINSFLGVTDPLYLLLIATSLTLFLFSNKKTVYFSFVVVSFATIIRGEGLAFFLVLSIMFFIRYRKDGYKVFLKYVLILGIFTLIILPISLYRIEVTGSDGIFIRGLGSGENLVSSLTTSEQSRNNILEGLELFVKYLIWVLIPNFIIFIPLGIFLIFRNRSFEKNTIILSLGIMILPALYAYAIIYATDTRYLYVLFPMFSVLAVLSIEKIVGTLNKSNIIVVIIILVIIISSIMFYDYQKIDYQHEKESFEIMRKISTMVNGTNVLYQESSYLQTSQTIEQWPNSFTETRLQMTNIATIPTKSFNSLENYIMGSKDKGLTHIIVDDKKIRQGFLKDVFYHEENYIFLEKVYDSKMNGYNYHVKVFEINYSLVDKNN